jgi:hypothetical protein
MIRKRKFLVCRLKHFSRVHIMVIDSESTHWIYLRVKEKIISFKPPTTPNKVLPESKTSCLEDDKEKISETHIKNKRNNIGTFLLLEIFIGFSKFNIFW